MTVNAEPSLSKREPAHPESINRRLATYLDDQRHSIIKEWMQRAGRDPAIPTETLTKIELRAHLPRLFDDLTATLCYYGDDSVAERAKNDVIDHTAVRWSQGYSLSDVLREIAHLRAAFLFHLGLFEELNPDFGMTARLFASATLHRFLDDLGIHSAEQLLKPHAMGTWVTSAESGGTPASEDSEAAPWESSEKDLAATRVREIIGLSEGDKRTQ